MCCEGRILPLSLQFGTDVSGHVRSRITYAFRIFAAIYGHSVVENGSAAAVRCFYASASPPGNEAQMLHIPALYQGQPLDYRNSLGIEHCYAGHLFYLSFGIDSLSGRPDWLGELFLWLSGGYEANIHARDSIGRIPYSETVFSRKRISSMKPHASLLMAWLESTLRNGQSKEALPKAPSPVLGDEHLVVCSHDIDFYFTNRPSALVRLTKNIGIAALSRQPNLHFVETLRLIPQVLSGKRVGHYIPALIDANRRHDIQTTFFAVARHGHRRDPNYRIAQIAPFLHDAAKEGFSVGLHGSYRSILEDRNLREEARLLEEGVGQKPLSNRQHWLRFGRQEDLFAQVAEAGLLADSSLGFPDVVGFRNGASFPFPPYDFTREAPFPFLEIPLVLMDGSLEAASRRLHRTATPLANEVLDESRAVGWGGVAVLWHNPLEPLSVASEINDVYWQCAARQKRLSEKWISVEQFLAAALPRFQRAGLLEEVTIGS